MKPNNTVYTAIESFYLDNIQDDRIKYQTKLFKTVTTEKGDWKFIKEVRKEKCTKTAIETKEIDNH